MWLVSTPTLINCIYMYLQYFANPFSNQLKIKPK